jgi:hypothetical protein
MDAPQQALITILSVKLMADLSRNNDIWATWVIWFLIHLETLTCASRTIKSVFSDSIRLSEDQWLSMPKKTIWERKETSNL